MLVFCSNQLVSHFLLTWQVNTTLWSLCINMAVRHDKPWLNMRREDSKKISEADHQSVIQISDKIYNSYLHFFTFLHSRISTQFLILILEGKLLNKDNPTLIYAYSLMRHTIVFAMSSLRLHLILSRTQKSVFNFSLAFSQFDCCPLSYIYYTGHYETLSSCVNCKADSYKANEKTLQAYFEYLPFIPQLHAMFSNSSYAKKCNTSQSANLIPTRLQIFFDGITTAYCWRLLLLLMMNTFQCGSSLILEILHLVY